MRFLIQQHCRISNKNLPLDSYILCLQKLTSLSIIIDRSKWHNKGITGGLAMDFVDSLKQFSERAKQLKDHLPTEESTKTALIMPFFQLLGYDVFNPLEFRPEFIADFGIKKGEKVDFAIYLNQKICMLIEAKSVNDDLSQHSGQLFRYFTTTKAKFGILTNGTLYKFYTDLEEPNKMDIKPFLEFDLLNIKETMVPELKKFTRSAFDETIIFNTASELKYSYEIRKYIEQQIKEPSDEFTIVITKSFLDVRMTQQVIEKFKPIVKKTFAQYISELMSDKLQSLLKADEQAAQAEKTAQLIEEPQPEETKVVTTEDEIAALFTVKGILAESISTKRIIGKDTVNYYNVTLDGKPNKWICRLRFSEKKKVLCLNQEGKEERIGINEIEDIYNYKKNLLDTVHLLDK
jgi:predicted type IV restriction endonuclease